MVRKYKVVMVKEEMCCRRLGLETSLIGVVAASEHQTGVVAVLALAEEAALVAI
jgi:hypothetical protein